LNYTPRFAIDARALRRAFNRASGSYDAACQLQNEVRDELLQRLELFALQPRRILDLGAGTGAGSLALRRRYRGAGVYAVDLADAMLRQAQRRGWPWQRPQLVAAEACALPFAAGSFELVFCSLMLQWCDDPPQAFAEIARVLAPGGLLLFATFGPATLQELRAAWDAADNISAHVSELPDLPSIAQAMTQAGLREPVLDRELRVRHYSSVRTLANELRALGAVNAARGRRRSITGKQRLATMQAAYELQRGAAGLPASYEIVCGAAFGAGPESARPPAGEVHVPVAQIGRRGAPS
jgi:malonyl-CoA O-methyltransferase